MDSRFELRFPVLQSHYSQLDEPLIDDDLRQPDPKEDSEQHLLSPDDQSGSTPPESMLLSAAGRSSSAVVQPGLLLATHTNETQSIESDQPTQPIEIKNNSLTHDWEHVSTPISHALTRPSPVDDIGLITEINLEIHQPEKHSSSDHQTLIHPPRQSSILKTWLEQLPSQPDLLSIHPSASVLEQEQKERDFESPTVFRGLTDKMESANVSDQNVEQDGKLARFVGSDLGPEDSASQVLPTKHLPTRATSPISLKINQNDREPLDHQTVNNVDEKTSMSSVDKAILQRFHSLRDSHFGHSVDAQEPASVAPVLTGDILLSPAPDAENTLTSPSTSPALATVDPCPPEKNGSQTLSSGTKDQSSSSTSLIGSLAVAVALGLVAVLFAYYYHTLSASLIETNGIRSAVSLTSWDLSTMEEDGALEKVKLDDAFKKLESLIDENRDEEATNLDEKQKHLVPPALQTLMEIAKDSVSLPSSSPDLVKDSTKPLPPSFSPALGQDSPKLHWTLITWVSLGGVTLIWISCRAKTALATSTRSSSCSSALPQQSHSSSSTNSYAVDLLIQLARDEQDKWRKRTNMPCPEKIEHLLKAVASNPTLVDLFGKKLIREGSKIVMSGIGGFFTRWVQNQQIRQQERMKKKEITNDQIEIKEEEEEETGVWAEAIRRVVSGASNSEVDIITAKISEEGDKQPKKMVIVKPEESDDEMTVVGTRRSSSLSRRRSTRSRSRSIALVKNSGESLETKMCDPTSSSSLSTSTTITTTTTTETPETKPEKCAERSGGVLEKKSPGSSNRSRKKVATEVKVPVRSSPRNKPLVKYNDV